MRMDGFPTPSTMRPKGSWAALHVSLVAALLLTSNADSQDSDCVPEVNVRRHTVHQALTGERFMINCSVTFCKNSTKPPPQEIWYKQETEFTPIDFNNAPHITAEWIPHQELGWISLLIFDTVIRNDSGLYQCGFEGQVSHAINVTVDDVEPSVVPQRNETKPTLNQDPDHMPLLLYVYPAAGILVFVIIVIVVSVAAMQGCKGKPKNDRPKTEYQCVSIPMVEQPAPRGDLQPPPRGSPSRDSEIIYTKPLTRGSRRKKAPPSRESETAAAGEGACVNSKTKEDKQRRRKVKEEEGGSLVVYAALNHQVPQGAAARPRRLQEESSEYAAIRFS
ncbi:B- and T-lymphocyte attenuator-like [Genypterus blacodes]|uniref:B- and T-lymphocyte attenuator-like n=1 Tax=Genypterus blacodes TaxID=154954 RepID=UPI003F770A34